MKKVLISMITVLCLLACTSSSGAVNLEDAPGQLLRDSRTKENLILQEIFRLDTRIQKNISQTQELNSQLAIIKQELQKAHLLQAQAEAKLKGERKSLNHSLRFFYAYGPSPLISSILISTSWSELLIRWELSIRLANYFLDNVRSYLKLQALAREKSAVVEAKAKELKQGQKNLIISQQALVNLKREQEKKLAEIRQKNEDWSRELLALEKAWSRALPSLQYLLQQLPVLPWQTIKPDNVEVDLKGGQVLATFNQETLNKKLFGSQEMLSDIHLLLSEDGLLIPGPDFEVRGMLQVAGPYQLLFVPQSVSFAGIPLERSTWSELLQEERLKLNLPPPVYGLQFKGVSLCPERMILILGW